MRHCHLTVPGKNLDRKVFHSRVFVNSNASSSESSNWKHDWFTVNNISYADVVKKNHSKHLSVTGSVGDKPTHAMFGAKAKNVDISNIKTKCLSGTTRANNVCVKGNIAKNCRRSMLSGKCQKIDCFENNGAKLGPKHTKVSKSNFQTDIVSTNRFQVLSDMKVANDNHTSCVRMPLNAEARDFFPKNYDQKRKNVCTKKLSQTHIYDNPNIETTQFNAIKCDDTCQIEKVGSFVNKVVKQHDEHSTKDSVKRIDLQKKHENVECDKYALPLHLKPRQNEIMKCAVGNATFENWNRQNIEKFGFIPLGNHKIPDKDENNFTDLHIFDVHKMLKDNSIPNFLGKQIRLKTELNIENWEHYLQDYWDKQLIFLLKYGFPLDFDENNPLISTEKNHFSAEKFKTHVDKFLAEEVKHNAILGPFDKPPLEKLHISPFLSREKPDSENRRIIVDLSFPEDFAVNSNISKDVYLESPFLLTLPTVDHIVQKILKFGKGSHISKVDISRAFRN